MKRQLKKNSKKIDWDMLWARAYSIFSSFGVNRQVAVLENFKNKKETICRILGIVKDTDLTRIHQKLEDQKTETK